MADGSIIFDTKIDRSGFEKGYAELQKEAKNLTKAMSETEKEIGTAQKALDKLRGGKSDSQVAFDMKMDPQYSQQMNDALDKVVNLEEAYTQLKNEKASVDAQLANAQSESKIIAELDKAQAKYESLIAKQKEFIASGTDPTSSKFTGLQSKIESTKETIGGLIQQLAALDRQEANTASNAINKITDSQRNALQSYQMMTAQQNFQNQQFQKQKNLVESMKNSFSRFFEKMNSDSKQTNKLVDRMYKKFSSLASMIKSRFKRKLISSFMTGLSTGMENLRNYSDEVDSKLKSMKNSANFAYNGIAAAVAPLLAVVGPVISRIIDLFATATNVVARFFAILAGQKSYVIAKKQADGLADANENVASSANAASAAEGKLASIDEVNDITQSSGGGGGGAVDYDSMFETVQTDGLNAFEEKFEQISNNVKKTIKNIADAWQEAWDFDDNGKKIEQALIDISDDVLDMFVRITASTAEWSEKLSLIPLVTGIKDVLESLEPVIQKITDAISWIWENLMLPIATWVLESGIPLLLETISAFLDIIYGIIKAMQPVFETIWNNLLQPIFSFLGSTGTAILSLLVSWLQSLADWINQNSGFIQGLITVVGSVVGAFLGYIGVLKVLDGVFGAVQTAISLVSSVTTILSGVFSFLCSPVGLVIAAIGALIAVLVLLATHWQEVKQWAMDCWNSISQKFPNLTGLFSGIVGGLKQMLWGLINFVLGIFAGNWGRAWNGVKDVFRGAFNGIVSIAESAVNFIIRALNRVSFNVPRWVPRIGGSHFGFNLSQIYIPRLATGTVVPPNAGEFMAVLGDNKKETEVVSPLSTIKQAVAEVVGSGNNNRTNELLELLIAVVKSKHLLVSDVGKAAAEYANKEYERTGESVFEGV